MNANGLAVKLVNYAEAHYEEGWDFIVECYDFKDLKALIEEYGFKSVKEFKDKFVDPHNEYAAEIKATAF